MGTLSKLNPHSFKKQKQRRAQAIRELGRVARTFSEGTPGRFRVDSLIDALQQVQQDPRFTSAQKDAKFVSLLNRAR